MSTGFQYRVSHNLCYFFYSKQFENWTRYDGPHETVRKSINTHITYTSVFCLTRKNVLFYCYLSSFCLFNFSPLRHLTFFFLFMYICLFLLVSLLLSFFPLPDRARLSIIYILNRITTPNDKRLKQTFRGKEEQKVYSYM